MQAQHAHAPISQASKSLGIASKPNRAPDAAEQFLDLLSHLVGKVSAPNAESNIEVRAAEQIEKKASHESEEVLVCESRQEDVSDEKAAEDVEVKKTDAATDENNNALAAAAAEKPRPEKLPEETQQGQREFGHSRAEVRAENAEHKVPHGQLKQIMKAFQEAAGNAEVKQRAQVENSEMNPQNQPETPVPGVNHQSHDSKSLSGKIEIEKLPLPEGEVSENLLLPSSPGLSQIKLPRAEVIPAAPKTETPKLSAALQTRVDLSPSLSLARASILDRALEVMAKNEQPLAALSLTGEKSKAVNVKETHRGNSLNARQEAIINQIQKLIDRAAQGKDGSTLTVKIQPDDLGQVTVVVKQRADQLFARVVPEKKEVEQTVRSGINELVAQLVSAGFKAENIHVSIGNEVSETALYSGKSNGFGEFLGEGQSSEGRGKSSSERHASSKNGLDGSAGDVVMNSQKQVVDSGWVA